MGDTCVVQAYTAEQDAAGEEVGTWTPIEQCVPLACGLETLGRARSTRRFDGTVVLAEHRLRVPVGTLTRAGDRIVVTQRFGMPVTPLVFEVIGGVRDGPSCGVVDLLAVEV